MHDPECKSAGFCKAALVVPHPAAKWPKARQADIMQVKQSQAGRMLSDLVFAPLCCVCCTGVQLQGCTHSPHFCTGSPALTRNMIAEACLYVACSMCAADLDISPAVGAGDASPPRLAPWLQNPDVAGPVNAALHMPLS